MGRSWIGGAICARGRLQKSYGGQSSVGRLQTCFVINSSLSHDQDWELRIRRNTKWEMGNGTVAPALPQGGKGDFDTLREGADAGVGAGREARRARNGRLGPVWN